MLTVKLRASRPTLVRPSPVADLVAFLVHRPSGKASLRIPTIGDGSKAQVSIIPKHSLDLSGGVANAEKCRVTKLDGQCSDNPHSSLPTVQGYVVQWLCGGAATAEGLHTLVQLVCAVFRCMEWSLLASGCTDRWHRFGGSSIATDSCRCLSKATLYGRVGSR